MRAVVVGGGLAGAAAALALADAGHEVTLLERRPALGGRAYSYADGRTGDVVDNGQHVLFGCYGETFRLLERLGTRHLLDVQHDLRVAYVGPEGETELRAWPLPAPLHLAGALLRFGGLVLRDKVAIARAMRAIERLGPREVEALDARTAADWLADLGQSALARARFWDPLAIAAVNELPETASARWLAATVRGVFLGPRAGSRVVLPRVGLSALWADAVAPALAAKGSRVLASAVAERLDLAGGEGPGRAGALVLADGRAIEADAFVLAVPHDELGPLLPEAVRKEEPFRSLDELGSSPIVSVHLWLDRDLTERPFVGLLGTAMQWLFNISRIRGGPRGHVCLVASAAHALAGKRREEIEALAVEELLRLFPAARGVRVDRAVAVVQRRATASLRPGLARLRPGPATPLRNVALAGDWTDPELPATIEAAVVSGRRAAARLLARG